LPNLQVQARGLSSGVTNILTAQHTPRVPVCHPSLPPARYHTTSPLHTPTPSSTTTPTTTAAPSATAPSATAPSATAPASPPPDTQAAESGGAPDRLIQRLVIECQSNERAVLKSFAKFLELTCHHLELDLRPIEYPILTKQRMTLLKSIFVHKKHRVQYEMRTYFMSATIAHLTGSTADTLLEWVQRMAPEGVAMHVVEHRLTKLPPPVDNMLTRLRQKGEQPTPLA